jgi:large repetitive protein
MNVPQANLKALRSAMKKSFIVLSALVSALVALVATPSASAAEITYTSLSGSWHDPVDNVPGSQPGDPVITNGTPISIIRWGETSGTPQSGYDFIAASPLPAPFELPGAVPFFSLGSFAHQNFEVGDPSLTSVQLDVVLAISVDGVPRPPLTFTFTFNHVETPNDLDPCPYDPTPPADGCSDRVSIVASPTPTTFNVDGVDYTLSMSFLDTDGNPVSEFITSEGGTINSSGLVGQFTPPPGTPVLTVDKSGPATMKPAEWGNFAIDMQNTGTVDAFNVTLVDRLPDGPTGGMCATTPQVLSARVFAADGLTPVPGKGPLVQGTDYSLAYNGPACELTFNTLSAASVIGAGERLLIAYRTQLDSDSQGGTTLTNVAGATQWFNGPDTNPTRLVYTRTLTDGTPAVVDHQDAQTVTVDLPVLRFEKTVTNVTTGQSPATHATPGDTLRYRIRIENLVSDPLPDFTLRDELGRLNAAAVYAPGTLNLVTVPAGADASNTNPSGGANNAGLVDIRNLSLGGLGTFIVVEYDVRLVAVLPNQSYVQNQAQAYISGVEVARSDDPNVGATAPDPLVLGDEDPTRVRIMSAPKFRVLKTSTYLGASTTVLRAGDRLRYTITIKNIGTDSATGVSLRDQIPANTTYIAGSTTLNGAQQNDNAQGVTPLIDGIPVYAPENTTPGVMRADATNTPSNVATIRFDVTVYPDLLDGTVISNQGFVSAVDFGIVDYPSDDPRTPIVNDPTRDVVGNVPLLFATKQAQLQVDNSSPGIVDPGDTLRYTITIYNNGAIPATNVILADNVPPNTTYVPNSTTLNGLPYPQPANGSSPLAAGVYVSSTDLTPPLPTAADQGTLSPNSSAVVTFDLRVNDGVASGTIIRNQAAVRTAEVPNVLTDGDGNPSTGPEPTIVVVGNGQQLSIVKEVTVVGGGPASQGATLEYLVRVTNISLVPALYVLITDDLTMPVPGYLTYVANSATLNGQTTGIAVNGQVITADHSTTYGPLQPQQTALLRFRAVINPDLLDGTKITNTGTVKWNDPPQSASASVTVDVGSIPGVGILNGKAWHDANFNRTLEANERVLEGWTVQLYRDGRLLRSVTTDVNGVYRISGIPPNYITGEQYELRFSAPDATASSAKLGMAYSQFTNELQRIREIIVQFASNLQDLNLPISPNGVAYNSVTRGPVAGVTLRMLAAGTSSLLPAECFDDPAQQNQVTLADGYYRFDLNFTDPACPSGGNYLIDVSPPPTGYIGTYSQIIPPTSGASTGAFSVPACSGGVDDALAGTPDYCEVQISEFAPPLTARARSAGTRYHAHLKVDNDLIPGSSQIYNNHIPVDPDLQGAIQISKTTPLLNVARGQLVPYVITYKNVTEVPLFDVSIVDRIPAGFRYVEGSARIDREPVEPAVAGRELIWSDLAVDRQESHELLVLLAVGAGVSEGEFVNRVQAVHMLTGSALSNEASATVRVVPDPTFDCTDVTGKVFDDTNRNGHQDLGETGLPGVRVVSARGLAATTDAYGRFHVTCAVVPREGRGSNFVLKLDDRTLPSGFRSSTDQVKIERATRGKALKFNFGASLHRVIGLDLADAVFEPGTMDMRAQWRPRLDMLMKELQKAPAILRLSYLADVENEQLVQRRLETIKSEIASRWQSQNANATYQLTIEPEVFWRLGAPPQHARDESR